MSTLPLVRRFPALARVPHVPLGDFPTPVQRIELPGERLAGEPVIDIGLEPIEELQNIGRHVGIRHFMHRL